MYEGPYKVPHVPREKRFVQVGDWEGLCGGEVQWMGNGEIKLPMLGSSLISLIQSRQCKSDRR